MSASPDEERNLQMRAIGDAISEGRYAVDPAGVARAVLARLAVPAVGDAVPTAQARRLGSAAGHGAPAPRSRPR